MFQYDAWDLSEKKKRNQFKLQVKNNLENPKLQQKWMWLLKRIPLTESVVVDEREREREREREWVL